MLKSYLQQKLQTTMTSEVSEFFLAAKKTLVFDHLVQCNYAIQTVS